MLWMKSIVAAILLSLGLGTLPDQPKADDKCEPAPVATVEQLGGMLEDLGYAPEEETRPDGTIGGFKTELVSWDYTVPMHLRISDDEKSLTITAVLSHFGDIEDATAEKLVEFLQLNNRPDNKFVYGIDENNMLTVQVTISLERLTMESLDEQLWNLDGELATTETLWFAYCPVPVNDDKDGAIG